MFKKYCCHRNPLKYIIWCLFLSFKNPYACLNSFIIDIQTNIHIWFECDIYYCLLWEMLNYSNKGIILMYKRCFKWLSLKHLMAKCIRLKVKRMYTRRTQCQVLGWINNLNIWKYLQIHELKMHPRRFYVYVVHSLHTKCKIMRHIASKNILWELS